MYENNNNYNNYNNKRTTEQLTKNKRKKMKESYFFWCQRTKERIYRDMGKLEVFILNQFVKVDRATEVVH